MIFNRKTFILGGTALLSSLSYNLFASPRDEKVLIIGAGAAGLYAAKLLNEEGVNVQLFEAASVIGGRARPILKFSDFPVELGADIIHGENSIYYKSILKTDTKIIEADGENYYYLGDKLLDESQAELDDKFLDVQKLIQEIKNFSGSDVTALEYFRDANKNYLHVAEALVGNDYGSSLSRIGIQSLSEAVNSWNSGTRNFIIRGRSHLSLLEEICKGIAKKIHLNKKIVKVNYSNENVQLTDEKGVTYEGTRAIVTVPLAILKNKLIEFNPPLPGEKVSAIQKIGMGAGMKIVMKFHARFWEENTGFIISDGIIPEYLSSGRRKSSQNNILTAVINGENAEKLSELGRDAYKIAIKDLDRIFGKKLATKNLAEHYTMDWSKDPNILGVYSFPTVGEGNARFALAKSINNTLFFAGEATNTKGHFATIHGAIESAKHAVSSILNSIG